MIAYRLETNKELEIVNKTWLYDVDESFRSKQEYIASAKEITEIANMEFKTNYTWQELFGEPKDIGWRYCKRCGEYYWSDEGCSCDY